jgi:predicted permease
MRDVWLAFRLFRKSPGFTLLAILCLAIGIGVNSSIFSLLDFVYLRPLPVGNADRLVVLSRGGDPYFSYAEYRGLAERSQLLAGLSASNPEESDLSYEGNAALIGTEPVSGNYAAVLGARTLMGRWFQREDEPAAVISYDAWQRLFHGDAGVLGKTVRSESHTYNVVGVAAQEFGGIYQPLRIDLWVPFQFWAGEHAKNRRVMLFGALKRGVTVRQAAVELNAIASKIRKEDLAAGKGANGLLTVEPVRGVPSPLSRHQALPVVILLMTVVSLVLMIACVNVGNLLLARGIGRIGEVAVRFALGASRARVLRQLMTENLVLSLAGGLAGVFVAYASNRLLQTTLPALPFGEMLRLDLPVDFRVLIYSGLLAVVTSLLCGLLPALQGSRSDLTAALKGSVIGGGRLRLRLATLTAQIALSLVLLLTAGLFARATLRLHNTDPGFAAKNRLYAPVFVPKPQFNAASARVLYEQTLNRLRLLPGIKSAAVTTRLPLYGGGIESICVARGDDKPVAANTFTIGAGFLNTMRIAVLDGRDFDASDEAESPPVALINQALARRLWPNERAVGRRFFAGCDHARMLQVVGVARDSKVRSLNEATVPLVYLPFSQAFESGIVFIMMETVGDPDALSEKVRETLVSLHPDFRTYGVKPLSDSVDASLWQVRFEVWVLGLLGTLALVLAGVGMYGVLAYHVTSRTREIGIRMALGARRADVFRLVMGQGVRVTLVGIAAGLVVAATGARLLTKLLYGVSPLDAATWAAAGARHRNGAFAIFFFCGTNPCVLDTLGDGGLLHARFPSRSGVQTRQSHPADRRFGRSAQWFHLRYQRPLRQAQLPVPSARQSAARPELPLDLQSSG